MLFVYTLYKCIENVMRKYVFILSYLDLMISFYNVIVVIYHVMLRSQTSLKTQDSSHKCWKLYLRFAYSFASSAHHFCADQDSSGIFKNFTSPLFEAKK